jgi:hypothetical protein
MPPYKHPNMVFALNYFFFPFSYTQIKKSPMYLKSGTIDVRNIKFDYSVDWSDMLVAVNWRVALVMSAFNVQYDREGRFFRDLVCGKRRQGL